MKNYKFKPSSPTLESCWRSSILIGINDKCYKFALGKSLLFFSKLQKNEISISELSSVYTNFICDHLKDAPIQGSNRKPPGKVLIACDRYNKKLISKDELVNITNKDQWVVLKKFHLIRGGYLPISFFHQSEKNKTISQKKIILTDDLFKLKESKQFENLSLETEGRWNLLERSWETKLPYYMLHNKVLYDNHEEKIFVKNKNLRKNMTGVREALNGYQEGKCFYCNNNISIKQGTPDISHVDHFFPLVLEKNNILKNLNGVWNLVLACKICNNGEKGKSDKLASIEFLEKLNKRNNYLIESYLPLREVLMDQTGNTLEKRFKFLNNCSNLAIEVLIYHDWKPHFIHE